MIEITGCYFDYNGHHYGWLWFYAGVWGFGVGAIPVLFTDPIPARTWQFSPLVLSDWNRNPKQWVHLKPCDIKTNLPSQIFRIIFPYEVKRFQIPHALLIRFDVNPLKLFSQTRGRGEIEGICLRWLQRLGKQ